VSKYRLVHAGWGYRLGEWQCHATEPGLHAHEQATDCTLVFPVAGAFVRERDGERELVDSTRVVFENAGEWYQILHPVAGGDRCTVLSLSEPLAESLLDCLEPAKRGRTFERQAAPSTATLYTLHRRLLSSARVASANALALDELAFAVMRLAVSSSVRPARNVARNLRHPPIAVQRALELIHATYQRAITLDEIARHAGYSPFHLTRVFRQRVGMTIHQYITRLRLRASYDAVLDGGTSLASIALSCGFSSHSHFTQAFRNEFGMTPTRLRLAPENRR
jgi:AraC-like DNA-binding protein